MDSRRPDKRDLARAYFCSEAVILKTNEEIKKYLNESKSNFSIIQFNDVHVSIDQENSAWGFKFLVAYAADATFIAFRGWLHFEDFDQGSQSLSPPGDVQELYDSFIRYDRDLLARLCEPNKRIIFCGHRLGGSVAHMVLVRFFNDPRAKLEDLKPDTMISFAFGAPNICSDKCTQKINANAHLRVHFFNVLDGSDPLPSLGLEVHEVKGDSAVRAGKWVSRCPIGEVVQLECGDSQSRSSSILGSCVPAKIKPCSLEKFSNCYKSAVIASCGLSSLRGKDVDDSTKMKVDSPAPHASNCDFTPLLVPVSSAKWKASDFKIFITIKGLNLLFLREPVKLDGVHPWETIVHHIDSELVITAPDNTQAEDIKAVSIITLKTAFGATTQVLQEDIDGGTSEIPLKVLPRIVQTFFVLANPPFSCLPPTKTLEHLDNIVQCVPRLKDKKLSELLRATANVGVVEEMNDIIDSVNEFLRRNYILQLPEHNPLVTTFECVAGCFFLAVALVPLPVERIALACSIQGLALGGGQLMIREYTDMLQLAINEASLWHEKKNAKLLPGVASDSKPTMASLESLLEKEVECSGSRLEIMIQKIHKSGEPNIELLSVPFQAASIESKRNLVRRMYIVAKTVAMYKKEVQGTEFLGVVGAEDAGKSTFIMKAIKRFGENPSGEVPEVGFKCHTTIVRPYKLKGSLYLVDFPGSDGTEKYANAWKQFTSLPSSCILLLEFKGDVKKDQMKMYKKMKKDLDSKVAVVFNKVDLLFSDLEEDNFDANYFKVHRVKTVDKLGCNSEDVHYVCLDPRNKTALTELQKMGVLDFEGLAKKIGGWLAMHSDSGSHHILME